MLHKKRLVMIDFQDARMGPCPNTTLHRCCVMSHVTLPEELVEELLAAYMDEIRETAADSRDRFRHIFDVMSLQRNIKALGTFGYQLSVRGYGKILRLPFPYRRRTCRAILAVIPNLPDSDPRWKS